MADSSENSTVPATVYLQLSDTGTIRKWSREPFEGSVEYRRGEREAIVAWLRSQATCGCKGAHGRCLEDDPPLGFADAIERGDHLPPPPTDNGGE